MTPHETITAAKLLIERSFSDEMRQYWTEGTITAALNLCVRNGELIVTDNEAFGWFTYWPSAAHDVYAMDFAELERRNLQDGPLIHIAVLISPHGYELVRLLAKHLEPYGISAHRWNRRTKEWRFTVKKNIFWNDALYRQAAVMTEKFVTRVESAARLWANAVPGKYVH